MTDQKRPITPPTELVMQWDTESASTNVPARIYIAIQSGRWGYDQAINELKAFLEEKTDESPATELAQEIADQELDACCDVIARELICDGEHLTGDLRTVRRPGLPISSYQEITIENASVGDTLEDGSIVLKKENGLALLVAPKSTEVKCPWSKKFPEVFQKLKEQGFNPSQWFVPTKEQLRLACQSIPNEFSTALYWSSTEIDFTNVYIQSFVDGFLSKSKGGMTVSGMTVKSSLIAACRYTFGIKANSLRVRAFRCVTY